MILDQQGSGVAVQRSWTPKHDQIVLRHLMGAKNTEIAAEFDMDESHIGVILKSDQALILIDHYRKKVIEKVSTEIGDKIVILADKGLSNLEATLQMPTAFFTDARNHQDKMGLEILKIYEKRLERQQVAQAGQIPTDMIQQLATALEKSARVQENHGKIVDGEYEILEKTADESTKDE